MNDEITKQAAQEYLAAKLTEETQSHESRANQAAAIALAPTVWKKMVKPLAAKCGEWNAVTGEQTLTCKETALGDIRVWCAGRNQQMVVHFDSRKLLVVIKNSGRLEHEKDVILSIEGYATGHGAPQDRDVRLMRTDQPVNLDMLVVGELRVLTGMSRQKGA